MKLENYFTKKKATLSIAESCTGGLISHMITNVAGSSDYFLFSGITYSNKAKIDVLGVLSDTISKHGAVDEAVVKEMASGVRRVSGTTYGLATSGVAGPSGGSESKPVGTVCIGISTPTGVKARRFHSPFGKRDMNKTIFSVMALDMLRRELLGIE